MAWTTDPGERVDLPLEGLKGLDGSGAYTSDWMESVETYAIRVAVFFLNGGSGTVQIEEGAFENNGTSGTSSPRTLRTQSIAITSSRGYAELTLCARYYRLKVSGGSANDFVVANIRRIS